MLKIRASQIFTRTVEDAVAAKKELDDDIPFTKVVEKYSECPSKKSGGDLGWMPQKDLTGLFGMKLTEIDRGKIIGPIHSQYGYHILYLSEVQNDNQATKSSFDSNISMNALQQEFPEIHTLLFKRFQFGMPVFGYKSEETLASVCSAQNKSVEEVVDFLNQEYQKKGFGFITCVELSSKLERKEPIKIFDIRESWERDVAFIPESILITAGNNETVLSSLNLNSEIVVLDWKGERSPSFQAWVLEKGFTNVKYLKGGIDEWAEKIDTRMSRYDIDEDDGYRYEDIIPGENES